MIGLIALPTPPKDEIASRATTGRRTYALPAVSGLPPPEGIFYRPTADPPLRAAALAAKLAGGPLPASPPLEPEEREVLFEGVGTRSLRPEDREVMYTVMSLGTSAADCQMAVDLIDYLISPSAGSRELCLDEKEGEDLLIKRYLYYWTSLSPHPLCILIGLVILLERLKYLHPTMTATGKVQDTKLRVIFSAYLLAMKLITDVSYANSAFLRRCPWPQCEINSMEREMLKHLDYNVFIASGVLLDRAKAFWSRRESEQARLQGDDGIPDVVAGGVFRENLFLERSS